MAGTLVANTINTDTGLFSTNNAYLGIAKAWVSFNGSANTIYSSFNISSITKNGTGQYVANISTAMSNTNYAVIASCSVVGSYPLFCNINSTSAWSTQAPTTTTFAINAPNYNASGFGDPIYYSAAVFSN